MLISIFLNYIILVYIVVVIIIIIIIVVVVVAVVVLLKQTIFSLSLSTLMDDRTDFVLQTECLLFQLCNIFAIKSLVVNTIIIIIYSNVNSCCLIIIIYYYYYHYYIMNAKQLKAILTIFFLCFLVSTCMKLFKETFAYV